MTRENFDMQIQIVLQDLADNCNSRYCSEAEKDHEIARAYEDIEKLIQEQFENRTCDNCKYYHQEYLCLEIGNGDFKPPMNFGCNKWESK